MVRSRNAWGQNERQGAASSRPRSRRPSPDSRRGRAVRCNGRRGQSRWHCSSYQQVAPLVNWPTD